MLDSIYKMTLKSRLGGENVKSLPSLRYIRNVTIIGHLTL